MSERFCQPVNDHFRGWNIFEVDLPSNYFVINIVILDINLLHLSVIDKIVNEDKRSLIVTFERDESVY